MKIEVHLLHQSVACQYLDVRNTYTKDGMFCIFTNDGVVYEHPIEHIFRVKQTDGPQFKPPASVRRKHTE